MKGIVLLIVVAAIGYGIYATFGGADAPRVSVDGDEVALATDDLDILFGKSESFDRTYMIFGGAHSDHGNAVSKVTLAGISIEDARPIRARYPDFHRCSSPGASAAKNAVTQLDIVPVDGETLDTLRSALKDFERNIGANGDRVCVRIEGNRLDLLSAEIRGHGQSVKDSFPALNFMLVDSANAIDCRRALDDA